jgi:hypothetical protein
VVEAVWRVVADVTRTGEWSHECLHVSWLGGATATFAVTKCPRWWEWIVARFVPRHIDRGAALTDDLRRIVVVAATTNDPSPAGL